MIGCAVDDKSAWLPLNGARYAASFSTETSVSADVVLVFDAGLLPERSLVDRVQNRVQQRRTSPFRSIAGIADGVDMVLAAGPGSSTASVTMELLAACGARRVVSVGTAAATTDLTGDGEVCVVESTTLAGANSPYPSAGPRQGPLFEALRSAADVVVPALTTLWPFRVDLADLAGVPGAVVEMEAATLHAVGDQVGICTETLAVISDRYDQGAWQLGDATATQAGLARAVDIAIAGLIETR